MTCIRIECGKFAFANIKSKYFIPITEYCNQGLSNENVFNKKISKYFLIDVQTFQRNSFYFWKMLKYFYRIYVVDTYKLQVIFKCYSFRFQIFIQSLFSKIFSKAGPFNINLF